MKEFIDKLMSRLEEEPVLSINMGKDYLISGNAIPKERVVEIVTELAEEYKVSEMPTGWITCENELPKEYTDVLGCDYNGNIYVLELYKDSIFGNIWRQWNGGLLRLDVIVAWQPLPAPFKEGE